MDKFPIITCSLIIIVSLMVAYSVVSFISKKNIESLNPGKFPNDKVLLEDQYKVNHYEKWGSKPIYDFNQNAHKRERNTPDDETCSPSDVCGLYETM